ncbi:hypothetical protein NM432_18635 (plasmid) [Vibrio metschnikovii]
MSQNDCIGKTLKPWPILVDQYTPSERHSGKDREILAHRAEVLLSAKNKNPGRWSRDIRNCEPVGEVHLNPEKDAA